MYRGNLGLLFYKDYFLNENRETIFVWNEQEKGVGVNESQERYGKCIEKSNQKLIGWKMKQEDIHANKHIYNKLRDEIIELKFKTTYPGLLIGSGYNHDVSADDAFKLGMEFDYTTGLPIIPASSVKGVLRSAFPSQYEGEDAESRKEYIKDILNEVGISVDVEELELNIFEGVKDGRRMSVYNRDVFYDAVISVKENVDKQILTEDYITPHKEELKNPTPIKFLKIASGIQLEFRFKLTDMDGKIDKNKKKDVFKRILLDLGIGSKTNVGYGKLLEVR